MRLLLCPNHADAHNNLAIVLTRREDFDKAIAPNSADARQNLAAALAAETGSLGRQRQRQFAQYRQAMVSLRTTGTRQSLKVHFEPSSFTGRIHIIPRR